MNTNTTEKEQRGTRRYVGTFGARAKCLCPRCGKTYTRFIFWTGKGTPRIFCDTCYTKISDVEHP